MSGGGRRQAAAWWRCVLARVEGGRAIHTSVVDRLEEGGCSHVLKVEEQFILMWWIAWRREGGRKETVKWWADKCGRTSVGGQVWADKGGRTEGDCQMVGGQNRVHGVEGGDALHPGRPG
eukprot:169921-Chlamydomonas_euryale.AAC.3